MTVKTKTKSRKRNMIQPDQEIVLRDAASLGTELTARTGGTYSKWSSHVLLDISHRDGCCCSHSILLTTKDFKKLTALRPSGYIWRGAWL